MSRKTKASKTGRTSSVSNYYYVPMAIALSLVVFIATPHRTIAEDVDFQRDILPILEERCWYCPGEEEQESGLRLDLRSKLLKGGDSGPVAMVPGHPEKSYLIDVMKHLDADVKMPLDEDRIPAIEIVLLEQWIKQGAVWPGQMDAVKEDQVNLWSFQPVSRPKIPKPNTEVLNQASGWSHEAAYWRRIELVH